MLGLMGLGRRRRIKKRLFNDDVTVALLGHSMMDQQTDPGLFENLGFINALQAVTGQRYTFDNSLNFGVSGDKSGDMVSRIAAVNGSGATEIFLFFQANDRRLKYPVSYTQGNVNTIIAGLRAGGAKTLNIITDFYGADDFYLVSPQSMTPAEIVQMKADTMACNDWLRTLAAPDIRIIEAFDVMVDGNGFAIVDNLRPDRFHPGPRGGWAIMERIYPVLTARYGTREFAPHPANKLANGNFAGTGGQLSTTRETGQSADGHLTAGSAPAGTPASRTYTKSPSGQGLNFAFPAAGSTRDNMRLSQRYATTTDSGKNAYYECELRVTDVGTGTGVWHALSAELSTSAGSGLAIGYDRGDVTDAVPVDLIKNFCETRNRTLLLRTPVAVIPGAVTYLEGRVNLECNTANGPRSGGIQLLNEQLPVY